MGTESQVSDNDTRIPTAPSSLGKPGRNEWKRLCSASIFSPGELGLPGEYCGVVDMIALLRAELAAGSLTVNSPQAGPVINRAVAEIRASLAELRKLAELLRVQGSRGQRRAGCVPGAARRRRPGARAAGCGPAEHEEPSPCLVAAAAPQRWIADPVASDFASPERLAFEVTSGECGDGLVCWGNPYGRLQHALDLFFGLGQWAAAMAKVPRWPGGWMPGRRYDPASYEVLPDGPPTWLRAAVDEYQVEGDERQRQIVAKNCPADYQAQMPIRVGVQYARSPRETGPQLEGWGHEFCAAGLVGEADSTAAGAALRLPGACHGGWRFAAGNRCADRRVSRSRQRRVATSRPISGRGRCSRSSAALPPAAMATWWRPRYVPVLRPGTAYACGRTTA
jgi:hypothetical protein